ncbi:MAG TPA: hypothetical protein ENN12_04275 [Epsilonproteobacteria bacterium]|nr:hypothetical protein [Campylobacterota bacterium]
MQFEEILEENGMPSIHKQTKISIEHLTKLFARDFSGLKKVQAYGFLSILEREYDVDLSDIKEECESYFAPSTNEAETIIAYPPPEKKFKMFWIWFILAGALVVFGWCFMRSNYLKSSIGEAKTSIQTNQLSLLVEQDMLQLETQTSSKDEIEAKGAIDINSTEDINSTMLQSAVADVDTLGATPDFVQIVPVKKLWFGLVNLDTKVVTDQIIDAPFEFDITKSWLVATSVAPFTLKSSDDERMFNDIKSHYFHIDKFGAKEITKDEFVSLGGSKQW